MRARRPNFYSLKRPKIRQSWNKYNLYNLANYKPRPSRFGRSFYQQKWSAKAATRGYHGPHIRERDWARMFDRRLQGTVELDPRYLAAHDGAEQSAGRGSGKQTNPNARYPPPSASAFARHERNRMEPGNWEVRGNARQQTELLAEPVKEMTPYMQMTFAPMERRLDVAIFRAMFASSTLQARHFCVHGAVTVNGKKMKFPAYQLNPGDMFQVDVERVLFATGKPKNPRETARIAKQLEEQEERAAAREAESAALRAAKQNELAAKLGAPAVADPSSETAAAETEAAAPSEDVAAATESALGEDGEPMTEEEQQAAHKRELKRLVLNAKDILKDKDNMNARQKQRLRLFLAEAKRNISLVNGRTTDEDGVAVDASLSRQAVMSHLGNILKGMSLDGSGKPEVTAEAAAEEGAAEEEGTESSKKLSIAEQHAALSPAEQKALAQLLREDAENPYDETKPYLTPWEPRDFMAPFAFIPRYLEVNHNICAAVYLRHPVARRGQTEVPTPFGYDQYQLAHNWYLRRR
ncbi:hypothetical protein F5X68DRAFT_262421 [Plectosphaerella plurivora]|uniref:RNA-binding S4 domain-containing protein n=1 Tax=Plectosphaerella plurivora TaxID=936078 RepID=A0A9P8VA64_9PEZI|nr:hypothetical protein F5X68DRAFT_262421 [Plectosphaerella plurivora]